VGAIATARHTKENLYLLNGVNVNKNNGMTAGGAKVVDRQSLCVWHARFGHPDDEKVVTSVRDGLVTGMGLTNTDKPHPCVSCLRAKAFIRRGPHMKREERETNSKGALQCDIFGPTPAPSLEGYWYFFLVIWVESRYAKVYGMKTKAEALDMLKQAVNLSETQFKYNIDCVIHDREPGLTEGKEAKTWFADKGIVNRSTTGVD
jgi:hypothetical protein